MMKKHDLWHFSASLQASCQTRNVPCDLTKPSE
jgi:hypothetical protein